MAADQQFCLRWNNHQSTLISVFDTLLASEQLVDCTLAAEGQYLKAHKVVLSACSPYLELLLSQHYEKHPIVILKDVKFQELKSMMDYMYRGEVNISQDQLATFLKAAESLQIKGLTDSGEDSRDVGSTKRVEGAAQGARKPVASSSGGAGASAQPPRSPAVLNASSSGLTIEPRQSSPHRSRDGSMSPTPRKRRRARRPSQGDDNQMSDSHIDTSNSCDLPSQPPSTASSALPSAAAATLGKSSLDTEHLETEQLLNSRLQNSNMDAVLIKEKVEPTSELMIEPKTEYMDENNEDSVEDLTLDDDDDMDMNRSGMDMGRPGPSHGDSNQGFATSWHMQGDRSGTDEVFMAAQEAVGAHRDSQDQRRFVGNFTRPHPGVTNYRTSQLEVSDSAVPDSIPECDRDRPLFCRSNRGSLKLMLKGRAFNLRRIRGEVTVWRCNKFLKYNCHAHVETAGDRVIKDASHNHLPDWVKFQWEYNQAQKKKQSAAFRPM